MATRRQPMSLLEAVQQGRADLCPLFFTQDVDVNQEDTRGDSLLHIALSRGFVGVADVLLTQGASLSKVNRLGQTPIETVEFGFIPLGYESDESIGDDDEFAHARFFAAVMSADEPDENDDASYQGSEAGPEFDCRDCINLIKLLQCAYQRYAEQHSELLSPEEMSEASIKQLLNQMSEVSAACEHNDPSLSTLVLVAAEAGNELVLRALSELGVNFSLGYTAYDAPLAWAQQRGKQGAVQLLERYGAMLPSDSPRSEVSSHSFG